MSNVRRVRHVAVAASVVSMAATIGLAGQVSSGMASSSFKILISCPEVNAVGDCVSNTPDGDGNRGACASVNALGACENQEQVEDPPHTMAR